MCHAEWQVSECSWHEPKSHTHRITLAGRSAVLHAVYGNRSITLQEALRWLIRVGIKKCVQKDIQILKNLNPHTMAAVWRIVCIPSRAKCGEFKFLVWLKLGDFSPSLWWTCDMWIFKQKQPRITDAELVTSLTLRDEETLGSNKNLVSHSRPGFSKNHCNDLWKRCGNDGEKRVALHTRRGLCQHRVVHEVDGLHVTGWLVYLIVTAARYKVSFLPPLFRNPANLRPLHQLLQQCSLSDRGPVFNPRTHLRLFAPPPTHPGPARRN